MVTQPLGEGELWEDALLDPPSGQNSCPLGGVEQPLSVKLALVVQVAPPLLPLQALGEGVQHHLAVVSTVTGQGVEARDAPSVEEASKPSLPHPQLDEDRALLLPEAPV